MPRSKIVPEDFAAHLHRALYQASSVLVCILIIYYADERRRLALDLDI